MASNVDSRVPHPIRLSPAHFRPVLLSALLCLLAVADAGAAIELRRIAMTGDHAPGTDVGVVFKEFSGLPGIGQDFAPQIDAEGNMDFHAQLEGPGVNNGNMFDGNALGIWKDPVAGSMTLVARQDDHAPGTDPGVEFMGFPTFLKAKILYAPSKASNAGGVAVSGFERAQNSLYLAWTRSDVDARLKEIMAQVHDQCVTWGRQDGRVNYLKGANIGGFIKVADAMLALGVV